MLVLVGACVFGLDDIVPTPYSGSSPGVELQARILSSVLDEKVPFVPSGKWLIGIIASGYCVLFCLHMALRWGRYAMLGLSLMAT